MISIIRVVIAAQFNMDDFTYDIAKASIVTVLEPCMGLIAACLPMFPAAFKRLAHGKEHSDPRGQNFVSSTVARLRSKETKKSAFHKIDDQYPLTDVENFGTQNTITDLDSRPNILVDDQIENASSCH